MDRDQRLIAFCQQAVRIPSPSGQEREVAQLMKRKMEEYGFDEVLIDRHGSVLGRMRGCRPGKTIHTQLSRGKRMLREALERSGNDDMLSP